MASKRIKPNQKVHWDLQTMLRRRRTAKMKYHVPLWQQQRDRRFATVNWDCPSPYWR